MAQVRSAAFILSPPQVSKVIMLLGEMLCSEIHNKDGVLWSEFGISVLIGWLAGLLSHSLPLVHSSSPLLPCGNGNLKTAWENEY